MGLEGSWCGGVLFDSVVMMQVFDCFSDSLM